MPSWDGVSAEREKISDIVGGLEDDPIPEVQIPELMGKEMTISTEVFAGQNVIAQRLGLGNNVVTGTSMAAGVQFGSQPEEGAKPYEDAKEFALNAMTDSIKADMAARNKIWQTMTNARRNRYVKRARDGIKLRIDINGLIAEFPNLEGYIDRIDSNDFR